MPRATQRIRLQRALQWLHVRVTQKGEDGGFFLLEVLIALSLITVIMAAVGVEFVSGVASTEHQRGIVNASQLASNATGQVRSLSPSDLLSGRSQAAVTTERAYLRSIPKVAPWISGDNTLLAYNDATASAVNVPTNKVTQKPGNLSYDVYEYIECTASTPVVTNPDGSTTQRNCSPASRTNSVASYLRLVVVVVWQQQGCPSVGCAFVTGTLVDGHANPTFDLNQPLPAAPVVNSPGDQTVAVGDTVSLQLTVQNNTGVAPFTWTLTSGSLPQGLAISPAGLISGTVQGSAQAAAAVTVQVTDAFTRPATATFRFTVLPQLVFNTVADKANTTADTVSGTLSATGGAGSPYTFTDPNSTLPPGVTLASTGTLAGKATTVGNYTVTLTVADSSGTRTATTTFRWTITAPPIALTNPGAQTGTRTRAITPVLQLSASGGSGNYAYAASGLPAGLSINTTTGAITGSPTSNGNSSVTATVTDTVNHTTAQQTFSFTIVDPPTITTPGTQKTTQGGSVSLQVAASCPNTPCTYALASAPNNFAINQTTGLITGTAASNAVTSTTVKVTVTDGDGATATTNAFTWTIYSPPTVTAPAAQQTTAGGAARAVTVSNTCANTPCTFSLANAPSGLSINGSGVISGTVSAGATTSTTVKVSITDASNVSSTTAAFTWTVASPATVANPGNQTVTRSTGDTLDMSTYVSGGTGPFAYAAANLPSWLSINTSTGLISGTSPNANSKTSNITVTVTDANGVQSTSGAFAWIVSDLALNLGDSTVSYNQAFSFNLTSATSGGTSPYSYTASGLPPGLSLSGTTVSGTPNTKGAYQTTLTVTDSVGAVVSKTIKVTVQ